jgi:hypothetical protein
MEMENNPAIIDLRSPKRGVQNRHEWIDVRISHSTAAEADANRREFFATKAALQAEIAQAEVMGKSLPGSPGMDAHIRDLKKRLAELRIKS